MRTNSKLARLLGAAALPMLILGAILSSNEANASVISDDNNALPQVAIGKPAPAEVVENPEVAPKFKDGEVEIYHRLAQNMKYPKDAANQKQQGKVIVEFTINPNGTASDFKISKSSGYESLDNEALRVCKDQLSSDWIPAKDKGKAVAASFTLPVMFRLQ